MFNFNCQALLHGFQIYFLKIYLILGMTSVQECVCIEYWLKGEGDMEELWVVLVPEEGVLQEILCKRIP